VNLGADYLVPSIADPLAAPPDGFVWRLAWSSESPEYGGLGTPAVVHDEGWHITGHASMVLEAAHDGHRSK
jgi:maltooligosyltrehalose trehalohydrolase